MYFVIFYFLRLVVLLFQAMELMMTGGQGELERRMGEDRELQEVVQKLGGVMKKL